MKGFQREDLLFSLCGLNCALCQLKLGGHCPGCGGGAGNQSCAIARCSLEQQVSYCHQCGQYPCPRYDGFDRYDSFISLQHRTRDVARFQTLGAEAYHRDLSEKLDILNYFLAHFNDGRRKTLFLTAAARLSLTDLRAVMAELAGLPPELTLKERAARAAELLQARARSAGVELKLRRKPRASV